MPATKKTSAKKTAKTKQKAGSSKAVGNYGPSYIGLRTVMDALEVAAIRYYLAGTRAYQVMSPAALAKLVGEYVFIRGNRTVAGFMGPNQKVSLVNGQLYLNALPLIAQSETTFESTGAFVVFTLDANGKVTRLALGQTEGDAFYEPKR